FLTIAPLLRCELFCSALIGTTAYPSGICAGASLIWTEAIAAQFNKTARCLATTSPHSTGAISINQDPRCTDKQNCANCPSRRNCPKAVTSYPSTAHQSPQSPSPPAFSAPPDSSCHRSPAWQSPATAAAN